MRERGTRGERERGTKTKEGGRYCKAIGSQNKKEEGGKRTDYGLYVKGNEKEN